MLSLPGVFCKFAAPGSDCCDVSLSLILWSSKEFLSLAKLYLNAQLPQKHFCFMFSNALPGCRESGRFVMCGQTEAGVMQWCLRCSFHLCSESLVWLFLLNSYAQSSAELQTALFSLWLELMCLRALYQQVVLDNWVVDKCDNTTYGTFAVKSHKLSSKTSYTIRCERVDMH